MGKEELVYIETYQETYHFSLVHQASDRNNITRSDNDISNQIKNVFRTSDSI